MRITTQDELRFSDWQRRLTLHDKRNQSAEDVAERQVELHDAVHGGPEAFAAYLREQLGVPSGTEIGAPTLRRQIDPSEFRDPPLELERQTYQAWRNSVTPQLASQPLFWTRNHIAWIEEGYLGEQLAPALLGVLQSGKPEKKSEDATRNLLRRLGGLPHVRGKVSVLNDCPVARIWWRGRLAEAAADASSGALDEETAHRVLHARNDAWSRLVGDSVKRITAINHARVRAAIICQYRDASREAGGIDAHEMQGAVRLLARRGPPLIFDVLDWSELLEMSAAAVAQAREAQARAEKNRKENAEADAASDEEPPEPPQPPRRSRRFLDLLRGSAGPDP